MDSKKLATKIVNNIHWQSKDEGEIPISPISMVTSMGPISPEILLTELVELSSRRAYNYEFSVESDVKTGNLIVSWRKKMAQLILGKSPKVEEKVISVDIYIVYNDNESEYYQDVVRSCREENNIPEESEHTTKPNDRLMYVTHTWRWWVVEF